MKKYLYFLAFLNVLLTLKQPAGAQTDSIGINTTDPSQTVVSGKSANLTSLTKKYKEPDAHWLNVNRAYSHHPDAGYDAPDQPAGNVIEVMSRRTESSRFFVDADVPGQVHSQGALGPLHYRSGNQWLTIDHRLSETAENIYEALRQPLPVGFNSDKAVSYIVSPHGKVSFNQWVLYGIRTGQGRVKIAEADWRQLTVGDDGISITNIFPGIDAEMVVSRGSVKTSFFLRSWVDDTFDEIVLADNYDIGVVPLKFWFEDTPVVKGKLAGQVVLRTGKNTLLKIGKAFMYAEPDPSHTMDLSYEIDGQGIGMVLKRNEIEGLLKKGTVVIDPLVAGESGALDATFPLNSSRTEDNANCEDYAFNEACSYAWVVPVPGGIQVVNTTHTNNMMVEAPCTRDKMGFRIVLGDDRKCGENILWFTNGRPATPGPVGGGTPNVIDNYNGCIEVRCEDYDLKVSLSILRACMGPESCEATCVSGTGPFITTITGRTLEFVSLVSTSDLTQEICPSEPLTLTANADFGVKPYTYLWNDGSKETVRTVSPDEDISYQVEITDGCQQKVAQSVDIKVKKPSEKPVVSIETDQQGVRCPGEALLWKSIVSVPGNYSYQWLVNGKSVSGADEAIWLVSDLKNGDVVSLAVIVSDECSEDEEVQSNELIARIYDDPVIEEVIELTGCDAVEYEGQTYYESIELENVMPNSMGCDSVRNLVRINIEHFAVTLTSVTPAEVNEGEPIHLKVEATVPDFRIDRWEPAAWFEDHQQSAEQQLKATQSETFIVHASSVNNCLASDTLRIAVHSASNLLLMPTAFSPNGDHINDVWAPLRLQDFPEGEIAVFSRWGQCVYYTSDYSIPWDGSYNGTTVPAGVYSFRLVIPGRKDLYGSVVVVY